MNKPKTSATRAQDAVKNGNLKWYTLTCIVKCFWLSHLPDTPVTNIALQMQRLPCPQKRSYRQLHWMLQVHSSLVNYSVKQTRNQICTPTWICQATTLSFSHYYVPRSIRKHTQWDTVNWKYAHG